MCTGYFTIINMDCSSFHDSITSACGTGQCVANKCICDPYFGNSNLAQYPNCKAFLPIIFIMYIFALAGASVAIMIIGFRQYKGLLKDHKVYSTRSWRLLFSYAALVCVIAISCMRLLRGAGSNAYDTFGLVLHITATCCIFACLLDTLIRFATSVLAFQYTLIEDTDFSDRFFFGMLDLIAKHRIIVLLGFTGMNLLLLVSTIDKKYERPCFQIYMASFGILLCILLPISIKSTLKTSKTISLIISQETESSRHVLVFKTLLYRLKVIVRVLWCALGLSCLMLIMAVSNALIDLMFSYLTPVFYYILTVGCVLLFTVHSNARNRIPSGNLPESFAGSSVFSHEMEKVPECLKHAIAYNEMEKA